MTTQERERTNEFIRRLDAARASKAVELEDEVAPVRALTLEQRGEWIAELCASAMAILRSREDFSKVMALDDPPRADYASHWRRLNEIFRRRQVGS